MRTYEKLRHAGMAHYNDWNFCSVIATATACNISFGKAKHKLENKGREHRKGCWHFYDVIQDRGFALEEVDGYYNTFVRKLGERLPKGTYIVLTSRHVACMVDGVMNDWSEDRSNRVRRIHRVVMTEDSQKLKGKQERVRKGYYSEATMRDRYQKRIRKYLEG